jgi:hypothetical protein
MSLFVDGAWSGWDGDTILQLTDGSVWRQAEYHYEYRYAYRPPASVSNGKMHVEGMSRAISVRMSLASVMGPPRCHEDGTTWRCQ